MMLLDKMKLCMVKIDIRWINFFFPNNLNVNKYLGLYISPNKDTLSYNYKNYTGLLLYKSILTMKYACVSQKM